MARLRLREVTRVEVCGEENGAGVVRGGRARFGEGVERLAVIEERMTAEEEWSADKECRLVKGEIG